MKLSNEQLAKISNLNKTGLGVSIIAGAAVGLYVGLKTTTVVAGATVAPGAISSTSTVVAGKTMVLSTVTASVGLQILSGLAVGAMTAFAVYKVYTLCTATKKESSDEELDFWMTVNNSKSK